MNYFFYFDLKKSCNSATTQLLESLIVNVYVHTYIRVHKLFHRYNVVSWCYATPYPNHTTHEIDWYCDAARKTFEPYQIIFLPLCQSSERHFRSVSLVSPVHFRPIMEESLDNLLHLLRPIFIASTYTCRCIHTYSPRSPLSSFRGIVGRDGDGFVMRDTSTDESSELTSKTRSCASIKPAIFLASRTRRVDRARWYSMRALSTRVCDKMHRRTRAACFSMCFHWITDAKIEMEKDSRLLVVSTNRRQNYLRHKKCTRGD